ncbi:toprim domain-containing protein [Shouchella patagoniensis]|uniref:toprim domain-containing protein n=1 Tax=Shouchella patagoniensis TaxID=228576 RepID=UPI000995A138|nr:toprim domain-containing protein [Shouchella patagoniensis]
MPSLRGKDRQGTIDMGNGRHFKGVDKHSEEHQGFHFDICNPDKLILFESPIDALSYYSVKQNSIQNARLMSMNGLKPATMSHVGKHMLDQGYKVKNVVLAVDNDKAGRAFVDQLKTRMRPNDALVKDEKAKDHFFQTDLSKTKDWNEDFKQMTKQGDQKEKAGKTKDKEPERER